MNKIYVYIALFFSMIVSSCTFKADESIVVPNQRPRLVVFCNARPDGSPSVQAIVVRTRNIGEKIFWDFQNRDSIIEKSTLKTVFRNNFSGVFFDTVRNVTCTFYKNDNLLSTLIAPYTKFPLYESLNNIDIKKNETYRIKVGALGFDDVTGEQLVPSDVLPTKVTFTPNNISSKEFGKLSELTVTFQDPSGEKNAYILDANFVIYDPKKMSSKSYPARFIKIDPNVSSLNVTNDLFFNGNNFTWRVGIDLNNSILEDTTGKNVQLWTNFSAVSPDLEKFYKSLDIIAAASDNSFSEPSTPFYNVKGGLGIFSISAKDTTVIIQIKK